MLDHLVSTAHDQEQNAKQRQQDHCQFRDGDLQRAFDLLLKGGDVLVNLEHAIDSPGAAQTQGQVARNNAAISQRLEHAEMAAADKLGIDGARQRGGNVGVAAPILANLARIAGIQGAPLWRENLDLDDRRAVDRVFDRVIQLAGLGMGLELPGGQAWRQRQHRAHGFAVDVDQHAGDLCIFGFAKLHHGFGRAHMHPCAQCNRRRNGRHQAGYQVVAHQRKHESISPFWFSPTGGWL